MEYYRGYWGDTRGLDDSSYVYGYVYTYIYIHLYTYALIYIYIYADIYIYTCRGCTKCIQGVYMVYVGFREDVTQL